MFATISMRGTSVEALTVPASAIVDSGREQVVFVAEGEGFFTPTSVKTGRRAGDRVEIIEGLDEGQQVAASATFFLDSESQLRGGLQNYERTAPPAGAGTTQAIDISFRSLADPPRTGENAFEVTLKDPAGVPVTDAAVTVRLFMPAMPTMNMPAMENDAGLPHVGAGVYRGPGQVMMGGRWDVTVTARRGTQQLGQRQFAIVAK
jgi:Cu(I)/Ag(I) efflux system membrane fusion protein